MIFLITDFGPFGPYLGQMQAVLARDAPAVPVIDLLNDAPAFDPAASAHLMAALAAHLPEAATVLGVVDPGVGTDRRPVAMNADGRWYVGPDNGLFDVVAARAGQAAWHEIVWRPQQLSASFHGRDLFAPVAAHVAAGRAPDERLAELPERDDDHGTDRGTVIYVDGYGNAMTGLRAAHLADDTVLAAGGHRFRRARTFGELPLGATFWYVNSLGLAELAVNQGSAAQACGLHVGTWISIESP